MTDCFFTYTEFMLQAHLSCLRYQPKQHTDLPLVSVCIPVRNAGQTIERAIDSILDQSYPVIELVVIDGNSDDGTLEQLMKYEGINILFSGPDKNAEDAINKAVCLATGSLICIVAADDWITRDHVSLCVSKLLEAKADLVIPALAMVAGEETRYLSIDKFKSTVIYEMPILPGIGWVATRNLFERIGLFNTIISVASDFDFLLRAVKAGAVIDYQPQVYYHHRLGGNSTANPYRAFWDTRSVVIRNGGGGMIANVYFLKWVFKRSIRLLMQALVPARLHDFIHNRFSRTRRIRNSE